MSQLLWIAVPGGIESGRAKLRVLIVPRLDGGSLQQRGMAQWPPDQLRQGTVRVEVHGPGANPQTPPALVRTSTPAIKFQSGLWERLVDGLKVENAGTPQAVLPEMLNVRETSDDAKSIAATLQTVFQSQVTTAQGGQSPDFLAKVRQVLGQHWSAHEHDDDRRGLGPPPASPPQPAGFHRTLSMLREHPSVLRALGLILKLELESNVLVAFAGGTVRVLWPDRPAALPAVVSPRTHFGKEFRPGSTASMDAGMVTLDRLDEAGLRRWDVVTVDIDLATQRLRQAAQDITARPDEPVTLPALRSCGLQLLLRGRGQEMLARLDRAAHRVEPDNLTADDLVLGYHIDVLPQLGGDWFSLQQQKATYRVHRRLADGGISEESTEVDLGNAIEEGHIKANAAVHDDKGLHADEIVAAWRGWSLSVPRPCFEQAPQVVPPVKPGMNVTMSFEAAPGSLPRLRFGRHYILRARVVDIAGGGHRLADPTPDRYRTPPIFYGRYEPVLAPDIAHPAGAVIDRLGPGETIEHVVVRSDPSAGLNIAQFASRFGYRLDDKRLLLPPPTTQVIAEQHGVFDDGSRSVAFERARRATEETLADPAAAGIAIAEVRTDAPAIPPRNWDGQWPDLQPKTVHLTDRPSGQPQVVWEAGKLLVRLAPAQQITLQLSTFAREGLLDEFALHQAGLPGDSMEAARQGRHPMLTPARTATFVHAVQRPLRVPETTLSVHREPGQTFATLKPNSTVLDPKSTGQLDVTASWDDVSDAQVATLTIGADSSPQPETLFRHDFGDTRHRTVTYTLRAVSRFRHYFRDGDAETFTRTSKLSPVVVLNSGQPDPPVVLSARPAFEWKVTGNLDAPDSMLIRQRVGNRVRITLQPPWHTTGAGELLAVVVRPSADDGTNMLDEFVTRAGYDPIYPSLGFQGGGPFAGQITSGTSETRTLPIAQAAADAVIKAHAPTFDPEEKSWLCDVAFSSALDHSFLRLAVARYQPHSIGGLWLSDVVKTDMLWLLPERTLRVTRHPDRFEVKLIGEVPGAAAVNRVDVILERCHRPAGMSVEQVDLIGFDTSPGDIPAWRKQFVQKAKPSGAASASGTVKHWTANIRIPVDAAPSDDFRVRVREVEFTPNSVDRPGATLQSGTPGEVMERVVYTDVVPLVRS